MNDAANQDRRGPDVKPKNDGKDSLQDSGPQSGCMSYTMLMVAAAIVLTFVAGARTFVPRDQD
jgi:hypothetical protein